MSFGPGALQGHAAGVTRGGDVDYRLARAALLAEYRKGRLARHQVCDAHPELLRNAEACGEPSRADCPVCQKVKLTLVTYVFGPRLPPHGRCISFRGELAKLHKRAEPLTAYVVEVCGECRWNHLVRAFPLGRGRRQ